jgi:hypothetical protein
MTIKLSSGLDSKLTNEKGLFSRNGCVDLMRNGVIRVYSGQQPDSADSPASGTLLGSITENGLPFVDGEETNGLKLLNYFNISIAKDTTPWKYTGVAAGTMGWFRFQSNGSDIDPSNALWIDGSVGFVTGDMRVSSTISEVGSFFILDGFNIK